MCVHVCLEQRVVLKFCMPQMHLEPSDCRILTKVSSEAREPGQGWGWGTGWGTTVFSRKPPCLYFSAFINSSSIHHLLYLVLKIVGFSLNGFKNTVT